jgi:hypothetical protein
VGCFGFHLLYLLAPGVRAQICVFKNCKQNGKENIVRAGEWKKARVLSNSEGFCFSPIPLLGIGLNTVAFIESPYVEEGPFSWIILCYTSMNTNYINHWKLKTKSSQWGLYPPAEHEGCES